ncbi:hypothetical protein [Mycobacterium colombiense]|uniref:hypothetical protein n=1 Tax=Mycobacterium colombiense TaxID=339268 RepID=UPI000A469466|nr:hypothetical protein [Mycobacterium colombiense]
MTSQPGLEVVVKGDLPQEVLAKISMAVQRTVRDEVATIDLLNGYTEEAPTPAMPASEVVAERTIPGFPPGHILGIIFNPPVKGT